MQCYNVMLCYVMLCMYVCMYVSTGITIVYVWYPEAVLAPPFRFPQPQHASCCNDSCSFNALTVATATRCLSVRACEGLCLLYMDNACERTN